MAKRDISSAERLANLEKREAKLLERHIQVSAARKKVEAEEAMKQGKREDRMKIIIGGYIMKKDDNGNLTYRDKFSLADLEQELTRNDQRKLFGFKLNLAVPSNVESYVSEIYKATYTERTNHKLKNIKSKTWRLPDDLDADFDKIQKAVYDESEKRKQAGDTPVNISHDKTPKPVEQRNVKSGVTFTHDKADGKIWIDGLTKDQYSVVHRSGAQMSDHNNEKRFYVPIDDEDLLKKVQAALEDAQIK